MFFELYGKVIGIFIAHIQRYFVQLDFFVFQKLFRLVSPERMNVGIYRIPGFCLENLAQISRREMQEIGHFVNGKVCIAEMMFNVLIDTVRCGLGCPPKEERYSG